MKRQIKISVCIAFLAVMLANPAWADEFVYKQIAVLEYGTGDNQIGLIDEPEAQRCGPNSFWVTNAGHVCILDSVNQKIKIFSASGKLLRLYDIDFDGDDLAVDDSGNIFVFDPSRRVVEHIDINGKKQKSVRIDELAKRPRSLQVIDGDVVFYTSDQKAAVLSQKIKGKTMLTENLLGSKQRGIKCRNGKRFRTFRNSSHRGEIFVLNDKSELINRIMLPIENVAAIVFLNQDKKGNSYFQLEISEKDVRRIMLSVYCLESNGQLHSVIENIPNNYSVWTAKLLQADDKGNIYQVLPTEDNVQINVWQRRGNGNDSQ